MNKTKVVHINKEPFDVVISRPSKWGNPYTHIDDRKTRAEFIVKTRKEAIEKYREYILSKPELLADLHELKDKTLACWCKPKSCHGDILIELIEIYCPDTVVAKCYCGRLVDMTNPDCIEFNLCSEHSEDA